MFQRVRGTLSGRAVASAIAGAICISTSAVVMKLAGSSPSMTALGRAVFALPVLGLLAWLERRRGASPMTPRARWLARIAGAFLGADLIVWSHAIDDIGAGLSTVIDNIQVVLVPLTAWAVLGERPHRRLAVALPVMLGGLLLIGGLAGSGGYGTHPALGTILGVGVGILYTVYILMLRQATAPGILTEEGKRVPVAAPLYEATVGVAAGALVLGAVLRDFRLGPAWPDLAWLIVLALTSQVLGWLLITMSMPRLPAWLVSILLLFQPLGSLLLGAAFLGERPSLLQIAGAGVMLAGIVIAASGQGPRDTAPEDPRSTAGDGRRTGPGNPSFSRSARTRDRGPARTRNWRRRPHASGPTGATPAARPAPR